jgi:outer membrane autotransporter protein
LSEQTVYTPTAVELVITQLTKLPENPTIFGDVESAAIDGGQAANTTLLSHLTGIRTGAAVDQMTMVNTANHRAGATVGSSPYGAWAQGQGGFGSVNGSGSAPSYNVNGGGFLAGADTQIGRGGVLGAAVGYDIASLSESGGASASIDTPRVAVYGGYWWGPVAFDATAGFGIPSISSDRPVAQTGTTAAASYVGNQITAAFQASSTISLGKYALTPAVGTQYTRLNLHGLSESGAGGFDLDAPSSTTNSLRPFIAATASTRYFLDVRTVLEPTLRVAYSEEVLSNSRQVAIIPSGDNTTFQIDGVKPSRGEASIDAGLLLETSHDLGCGGGRARQQQWRQARRRRALSLLVKGRGPRRSRCARRGPRPPPSAARSRPALNVPPAAPSAGRGPSVPSVRGGCRWCGNAPC